jgi:hypothetical protein
MTQNLEWNHALDAFAYLLNRPSFSVTEICSVPCNLNAKIAIPRRAENEKSGQDIECFGVDLAEGQDRSVAVEGVFHCRDNIYEITGMYEIRTDCKYYSGNRLLFCAVNTKCDGCVDYCPE